MSVGLLAFSTGLIASDCRRAPVISDRRGSDSGDRSHLTGSRGRIWPKTEQCSPVVNEKYLCVHASFPAEQASYDQRLSYPILTVSSTIGSKATTDSRNNVPPYAARVPAARAADPPWPTWPSISREAGNNKTFVGSPFRYRNSRGMATSLGRC